LTHFIVSFCSGRSFSTFCRTLYSSSYSQNTIIPFCYKSPNLKMSDNIPFEIQQEIMRRLPVKSLIQFRSVSKSWKSLIDSSTFIADYQHTKLHQHILVRDDFEQNYVIKVGLSIWTEDPTRPDPRNRPKPNQFDPTRPYSVLVRVSVLLICRVGSFWSGSGKKNQPKPT
jgi:hypothetical protein